MRPNYADIFREDLKEFREVSEKFYNKEMSVPEYKHFSGAFGSYAQRGGNVGMLRLRLCGGRIPKDYLKFIVESVEKYHVDLIHITTCQALQLHNLSVDVICPLMEAAWDHGFITRGAGGDYPRNVMVTPRTGVEQSEYMNLTPYAEVASDYLLSFIKKVNLPRKLKVCFSCTTENWPHATFRDLGFVATPNQTFDVYCAGGLGPSPKMGVLVAEDVNPSKILYYIKAMINTFTTYGNYEKRTQSRTRYMQDTLGVDGLKKAYQAEVNSVLEQEDLDIDVVPHEIKKTGEPETFDNMRISEQKQPGLYSVYYHPIGGNPTAHVLRELYDAIEKMEEVELRLTPNSGLFIINCNASEAKKILEITKDSAKTEFETSVACIGNHICQIGLRDSQDMLRKCIDAVAPFNFADGVLPKIRISGCPSSCSAHQIAPIGFRGAMKKTDLGMQPGFAVFEGGEDNQGHERFGDDIGVMTIDDIPAFFVELGKKISEADSTYKEWIKENHDLFLDMIKQYC